MPNNKIDPAELEAFRLTLPEGERHERFEWLTAVYDVVAARFVICKHNLTSRKINVKTWAEAFGMGGPEHTDRLSFNLLTGVSDHKALEERIDPSIPIILIEHTFKAKRKTESTTLILDGNHRLRKALLKGQLEIEAFYLPKELSKLTKLR